MFEPSGPGPFTTREVKMALPVSRKTYSDYAIRIRIQNLHVTSAIALRRHILNFIWIWVPTGPGEVDGITTYPVRETSIGDRRKVLHCTRVWRFPIGSNPIIFRDIVSIPNEISSLSILEARRLSVLYFWEAALTWSGFPRPKHPESIKLVAEKAVQQHITTSGLPSGLYADVTTWNGSFPNPPSPPAPVLRKTKKLG